MYERKPTILFLCSGNSCRSQMAEGFLRKWAGNRFEIFSAGLEPQRVVHPLAVEVMDEIGIDLRSQSPKSVTKYLGKIAIANVIFLCERAEEMCPYLYPGVSNRLSWPFEDPTTVAGSTAEKLEKFRTIRDQIGARIQIWLRQPEQ